MEKLSRLFTSSSKLSKESDIDCRPFNTEKEAITQLADNESYTELHSLVFINDVSKFKKLSKKPDLVNSVTEKGVTLLHVAAMRGHLEIANLLLEMGASPCSIDSERQTPLHLAAREGHAEIVKILLEKCPDVIRICTNSNETPLHLATGEDIAKLDLPTIQLLAKAAKNNNIINVKNFFLERTALHQLYCYSRYSDDSKVVSDVINCLIENGADPTIKDRSNKTPGEYSVAEYARNNPDAFRKLEALGLVRLQPSL